MKSDKISYVAASDDALRNASYFRKRRVRNSFVYTHYILGDYHGDKDYDAVKRYHPDGYVTYTFDQAKKLLPKGFR